LHILTKGSAIAERPVRSYVSVENTNVQITHTDPPCQTEEHFQQLPRFIQLFALFIAVWRDALKL